MNQELQKIGPYTVEAEIGRGGMGVVYRATDPRLDRTVAIKALPEDFNTDGERLARLELEARSLASVNHPNVAGIHGIEEHEGHKYLVLEYVDGEDLAERLDRGPLPVDEALEVCEQIAAGLEAAHEAGIIHRDLKPGNVKLTPGGKIKVLDFGLAKAVEATSSSSIDQTQTPTLTAVHSPTAAGVILGTAPYMSPEQARGRPVDRRADIWSFGVVLYECLTGASPFVGETISDSIAAILQRDVDLSLLPAATPAAVRRVLGRCLARDKDRRYRHMGDVRLELLEAREAGDEVSETIQGRKSPLLPWVVAATASLGLAASLVWLMFLPRERPGRLVTEIVPLDPAAEISVRSGPPALSPDGERLAYVVERGGETVVVVRDLTSGDEWVVDESTESRGIFWSPDARTLGVVKDNRIMILPEKGGRLEPIPGLHITSDFSYSASWGADGSILYGTVPEGLMRVQPFEGDPELVIDPDPGRIDDRVQFPVYLPGDTRHLFSIFETEGRDTSRLVSGEMGSSELTTVLPLATNAVVTDAKLLFYERSGRLLAQPFDVSAGTVEGEPVVVAHDVRTVMWPPHALFSVSRKGRVAYVPGDATAAESELVWIDRATGEATAIGVEGSLWNPRVSPDGKQVAFDSTVAETQGDIWIRDLERGIDTQLTRDPMNESFPVWMPDGRAIIFFRGEGVYRVATDGISEAELIYRGDRSASPTSISPDGQTLIFNLDPVDGKIDVLMLDLESLDAQQWFSLRGTESPMALSRDGRWFAYSEPVQGRSEIFIRSFPDGEIVRRVSIDGGNSPKWSRGNELFFTAGTNLMGAGVRELENNDVEIDRPTRIVTLPPTLPAGYPFDVAPDGRRFVTMRAGSGENRTVIRLIENWDAGGGKSE